MLAVWRQDQEEETLPPPDVQILPQRTTSQWRDSGGEGGGEGASVEGGLAGQASAAAAAVAWAAEQRAAERHDGGAA